MKKIFIIFFCACVAVTVVAAACLFYIRTPETVGEFDVSEYQDEIDEFPSDKNVGQISDANDATKKAVSLWIDMYGLDVIIKRPYEAYFDEENGVWLVMGTFPFDFEGGSPYALIEQETGKVLAIWHDR